jgi:LPXTG-motif cell wall-anchored protein
MGTEDVMLTARWLIDTPIINPINPGDTCVTGVGAPGSTAYVYDENGNIIGTVVVGADGTFTYCDDSIGEEGSISVELVDPDGNQSDRVSIKKPGSGIVSVLPETGVNTLETLVFGLLIMILGFVTLLRTKKLNN